MEQIRVSYRLVIVTLTYLVCLGFNVGMCSESDPLIKTYVSSILPSNDDLVYSTKLQVHSLSESEWDSLVIQSEVPVMVMFTAAWCRQCQVLSPVLDELDSEFKDKFKFYTVDVDEEPGIADRYHIRATLTSIVFKGGHIEAEVIAVSQGSLRELVRKYI